jgi:hypothetical protein
MKNHSVWGIVATSSITTILSSPSLAEEIEYSSFTKQNLEGVNEVLSTPITPVSHLADVRSDDWNFHALQSFSERYDCLSGYSNDRFAGEQFAGEPLLTRYEFAAALSACIDTINAKITTLSEELNSDSFLALQRLQSDFTAELATLQEQVDVLEAQTTTLEAQSFSTTTQLEGEVILGLTGVTGNRRADESDEPSARSITGGNRVRLEMTTSFTGSDQLRMRLQARDILELETATGTPMANLGFDGSNENNIELDRLDYEFEIGDRAFAVVSLVGGGLGDYVSTVNPLFSGSSDGSISTFGRENPIRRQGGTPGIGLTYELSEAVNFEMGYVASQATDPEVGIARSPYGAIGQLTVEPTDTTRFSLTYLRSFNSLDTGTGSFLSADPFEDESDAITANSLGAEVSFEVGESAVLGGRIGLIQATAEDLADNPQADIFTWAVLAGLQDLGGEGNLAGLIVGQPPRVIRNEYEDSEEGVSWHLEAFYRWRVTDRIAITPGIITLLNPENNAANDPIYIGTVRATFTF